MLLRLLMFGEVDDRHPSSRAIALMLPAFCASHTYARFLECESLLDPLSLTGELRLRHKELIPDECRALKRATLRLLELEPKNAPFLPQISFETRKLDQSSDFKTWISEELLSIELRSQAANLQEELKQLVPSTDRNTTNTSEGVGYTPWTHQIANFFMDLISTQVDSTISGRNVFSTERTERLGLSLNNLQIGDEIWYLHGAAGPCVLRPRPTPLKDLDGERSTYQFVGMVYIEGLMYGQIGNEPNNGGSATRTVHVR